MKAITFAASLLLATPALAAPIHQFDDLALAPAGDKIATVESDDPGNLADEPHGTVVVRDAGGKIIAHYDPCADLPLQRSRLVAQGRCAAVSCRRREGRQDHSVSVPLRASRSP